MRVIPYAIMTPALQPLWRECRRGEIDAPREEVIRAARDELNFPLPLSSSTVSYTLTMACRRYSFARVTSLNRLLRRVACVTLALLPVAAAEAQPSVLHSGSSVTRDINRNESQHYEVALDAGELITLTVFAEDLNFTLHLIGPDG